MEGVGGGWVWGLWRVALSLQVTFNSDILGKKI